MTEPTLYDRTLLERIEQLERRIQELEQQLANEQSKIDYSHGV